MTIKVGKALCHKCKQPAKLYYERNGGVPLSQTWGRLI
jgi:hypothetical protein